MSSGSLIPDQPLVSPWLDTRSRSAAYELPQLAIPRLSVPLLHMALACIVWTLSVSCLADGQQWSA